MGGGHLLLYVLKWRTRTTFASTMYFLVVHVNHKKHINHKKYMAAENVVYVNHKNHMNHKRIHHMIFVIHIEPKNTWGRVMWFM